ncbi:scavenger receptor cysteine-rich type 1 protein M130-like [Pempheris klunzingeri]|uniref:scavenger receptor cysteine-rich type 1 protein M130-like n=1 Tax=Pempheris klunzingeri TaxID=3127111 RepID=UPI003980DF64
MDHLLKVLLLLCSSGARCETEDKADIVLLMDDSGSISASTFKIMKDFFKRIVGVFDIGPDKVQIGLVRYSSFGQTMWNLNTYQTKQSVLEAVDQLIQTGGDTMTGRALKYILHTSFKPNAGMRADSQKIAVLITDGESLDDTLLPSQDLKDTGIEVYTIGVSSAKVNELRSIASDPDETHMYFVRDSPSLMDIFDKLIINLCNSIHSSDSVRLVNGTSPCSGRLEVKSDQSDQSDQSDRSWSSVCEADFDQQDAEVVCRELGCGAPLVLKGGLSGDEEAPMWPKEFQCGGHESALLDCRSSGSARDTCSPGKAVGLTCSEPDHVRLVGGSSRCAGTLELKRGVWRPVSGSDWTLKEAAAACEELDCGAVLTAMKNESLHRRPVWEISSTCVQPGSALKECASSDSSSSIIEITCSAFSIPGQIHTWQLGTKEPLVYLRDFCHGYGNPPGKVVGLTCSDPVRLVGGSSRCAGTLEVKRGEWRPVSESHWTLKEASAACRELNCGSAVSTGVREEFSHKSSWLISPGCVQSGLSLRECVSLSSSPSAVEITCLDSVRLVNGTSLCSGRLKVKLNQSDQFDRSWSSVCEADFDQQDAEVVCRELGCGAPLVLKGGLSGDEEAPMWPKEFQCGGHESALLDCRSSGSARDTCSPGKAVGLTCSEPDHVRLVGGSSRCAGTLELKLGEWRPVSGSDWTLKEAAAVCRQLDCGSAASTKIRIESSRKLSWWISSDCVQSGSSLRECISVDFCTSVMEMTCYDPAVSSIRLILLPLALLTFITAVCFVHKTTRGQNPGPQENMELDYHKAGVCRAEGGLAEEEGAQAAE